MKPRVAFLSVVPSPYQRDLFQALAQRDEVDLHVFYLEAAAPDSPWPEKPLADYESILPGRWYAIGAARCHWNWPLPHLRRYDLVVLNTLMSFTAQYVMRVLMRGRRWAFWGERLQGTSRLHRIFTAPLHRATGIVAIGSRALGEYAERFPLPLHFDIPYHCDLQPFLETPRPARDGRPVRFLFCGQMIARKGLDHLLQAFTQLQNAELHLVGREAELPEMLAPLPAEVRSRIVYHGFHDPARLCEFFGLADVFILPSRYDGWGVVVNQALGAGLPIICSDAVGAGLDLVEPGVNGFRFLTGSVAELATAMQRFVAEPALITAFGEVSRQRALDWLPERGAERWIAAINTMLRS
ncbi:MAG: glycosyltransferase family 4 protein [Chthoniobacteraceae bacterium]